MSTRSSSESKMSRPRRGWTHAMTDVSILRSAYESKVLHAQDPPGSGCRRVDACVVVRASAVLSSNHERYMHFVRPGLRSGRVVSICRTVYSACAIACRGILSVAYSGISLQFNTVRCVIET